MTETDEVARYIRQNADVYWLVVRAVDWDTHFAVHEAVFMSVWSDEENAMRVALEQELTS